MFGNPMEIALIVGAAVLLFGADKLPKLARSVGTARKEYQMGQVEADLEAERVRNEARAVRAAGGDQPAPGGTLPGTAAAPPPAPVPPPEH